MRGIPYLILSAAVATLAGCGDSTSEPVITAGPGEFEVELTGVVAASVEGAARIESLPWGRQVFLWTTDGSYEMIISAALFADSGFDFQVGTHEPGPMVGFGSVDISLRAPSGRDEVFFAVGGQLRITESTPDRIVGWIDVPAAADSDPGRQVRIRGSFHATTVDWSA